MSNLLYCIPRRVGGGWKGQKLEKALATENWSSKHHMYATAMTVSILLWIKKHNTTKNKVHE